MKTLQRLIKSGKVNKTKRFIYLFAYLPNNNNLDDIIRTNVFKISAYSEFYEYNGKANAPKLLIRQSSSASFLK